MLIPDPVQDVIDTHLCNTVLRTAILFWFFYSVVCLMCFLIFDPEHFFFILEGWGEKKKQNNAAKKSKMNICIGIWPTFVFIYL